MTTGLAARPRGPVPLRGIRRRAFRLPWMLSSAKVAASRPGAADSHRVGSGYQRRHQVRSRRSSSPHPSPAALRTRGEGRRPARSRHVVQVFDNGHRPRTGRPLHRDGAAPRRERPRQGFIARPLRRSPRAFGDFRQCCKCYGPRARRRDHSSRHQTGTTSSSRPDGRRGHSLSRSSTSGSPSSRWVPTITLDAVRVVLGTPLYMSPEPPSAGSRPCSITGRTSTSLGLARLHDADRQTSRSRASRSATSCCRSAPRPSRVCAPTRPVSGGDGGLPGKNLRAIRRAASVLRRSSPTRCEPLSTDPSAPRRSPSRWSSRRRRTPCSPGTRRTPSRSGRRRARAGAAIGPARWWCRRTGARSSGPWCCSRSARWRWRLS